MLAIYPDLYSTCELIVDPSLIRHTFLTCLHLMVNLETTINRLSVPAFLRL